MKNISSLLGLLCLITGTLNISAQGVGGADFSPLQKRSPLPEHALYNNPDLSPESRALDLINYLTFREKLEMTGGWERFYFPGFPRLGLRPVRMSDASQGIRLMRGQKDTLVSTSFPCMLALASTWDPDLAESFGEKMGEECRALGIDILLGPGINMYRTSEGGRNYEYMGEDPYLTSEIVTSYVTGLQSRKIIATAKHFICNDQEFCRHIESSDVSQRALREIYLPPWKAAIEDAGLKAVMTGNNMVNGIPCSMNKPLIQDILRDEYGFTGIAMTDWQNTCYHPERQNLVLPSGESLLMPTNKTFADYLVDYVIEHLEKKDEVEAELNTMIYHNLLTFFEMGIYDRRPADPAYESKIEQHKTFARKCAEEAICLLKNQDDILPISQGKKILMMGEPEIHSGQGSGFVEGYDHIDFCEGLENVYGDDFTCIVSPSDEEIQNADVVFYRLNKAAGEGHDVPFDAPKGAKEEILHCAALNPNIVVIISSGNGLDMSWLPEVRGVLWTYFLGQERGPALAAVVSGKTSPSGHLPFTIEKAFKDSPDPTFNFLGGKPYWQGDNKAYKEYWLGH
ncbi:MAG TPA: glycoside hydrolase family 3 N-terminal domain-containing protein, partial [Bacteroidales bacterium]|nr:glycoside hydrolase family 3 N-terminal domain-containing protein [Bacteroidales bacterium]